MSVWIFVDVFEINPQANGRTKLWVIESMILGSEVEGNISELTTSGFRANTHDN
jgi:hypothetical protein